MTTLNWPMIFLGLFLVFLVVQNGGETPTYILLMVIVLIIFFISSHQLKEIRFHSSLMKHLQKFEKENHRYPLGKILLKTNINLSQALVHLSRFAHLDKGCFDDILHRLYFFLQLYCELMLGSKQMSQHFSMLVETRREVVNLLYSFLLKSSNLHSNATFENTVNTIMKSTKTYLRRLKNKYDFSFFKHMPYNYYRSNTSLDYI